MQKQSFFFPWDSKWPPRDKALLIISLSDVSISGVAKNCDCFVVIVGVVHIFC